MIPRRLRRYLFCVYTLPAFKPVCEIMKTFEFKTLGCKVNQYESQALREKLSRLGFRESEGGLADIYVVNTCAVTQKADRESFELVRKLNRHNPKAQIFVTGCSAQNNPDRLQDMQGIAGVVDNRQKESLPDFILGNKNNDVDNAKIPPPFDSNPGITKFDKHTRAFLKIQDGCNNGCSYCIIPHLRGKSRSRFLPEIIAEAKNLVANGYKEIVLCGICLGAYGRDLNMRQGLVRMIESLEEIQGLLRIRLSSIEASDISPELINKMAASKKLCRHLHIPFQSGDDKILRLMNRKTNSSDYLKLIFGLRKISPDIGITTDIMIGFPGEDEASFNSTFKFLKEAMPSRIHIFPFSPRKNTPAFSFHNMVRQSAIKERQRQISALAKELSLAFCQANLGKALSVLVESNSYFKDGIYNGYSDNYLKVIIPNAEAFVNTIVIVKAAGIYQDGIIASLA